MKLIINDKNDFENMVIGLQEILWKECILKKKEIKLSFRGLIAISRRYVDWSQKKKKE